MGIILIISSISFSGIINLMEIVSGNIYEGIQCSSQFNGAVNNGIIQAMAGKDIITGGKVIYNCLDAKYMMLLQILTHLRI